LNCLLTAAPSPEQTGPDPHFYSVASYTDEFRDEKVRPFTPIKEAETYPKGKVRTCLQYQVSSKVALELPSYIAEY